MKKVKVIILAGALLSFGFGFTSCDSNSEDNATEQTLAQDGTWYCPMECEKDDDGNTIMHAEPGQCSVCEMDLVEI